MTREADVKRAIARGHRRRSAARRPGQRRRHPAAERVLGKEGAQPLAHFARVVTVNLIGTFNVIRLAAARDGRATRRTRTASAA